MALTIRMTNSFEQLDNWDLSLTSPRIKRDLQYTEFDRNI